MTLKNLQAKAAKKREKMDALAAPVSSPLSTLCPGEVAWWKITSPNECFHGEAGGVWFSNGVAHTQEEAAAHRCADLGYTVERRQVPA